MLWNDLRLHLLVIFLIVLLVFGGDIVVWAKVGPEPR